MVTLIGGIATVVGGYFVLRHTVTGHEKKFEKLEREHNEFNDSIDRRINAGFKRLDEVSNRTTILEQSTKEHLGLREAEDKFVTQKELQLHLKNIEDTVKHIERAMITANQENSKKLDYLTELMSTNIVKSVIPHGQVYGGGRNG